MAVARKVFTEAMVRKVLSEHFAVDPLDPTLHGVGTQCHCGWLTTREATPSGDPFDDHFVDQLHKRWHETIGRRKTTESSQ